MYKRRLCLEIEEGNINCKISFRISFNNHLDFLETKPRKKQKSKEGSVKPVQLRRTVL